MTAEYVERICARLGLAGLTGMQQKTLHAVTASKDDVVILSPTGSGKTLAYMLPLAVEMKENPDPERAGALVIVPGRELAQQSATVLASLGMGISGMALYGGRATMDEHRLLTRQRPSVFFATPGRLNDHLDKGNIDVSGVRYVVIDEFDKCLQMGFQDEMRRIFERIPAVARRVLLSATDAEDIPLFVRMQRTQRIDFREKEQVTERVSMHVVASPDKDKLETLSRLLRHVGQERSVVFLNHRESVERTAGYLREQGFIVSSFHGGYDQRQREDALYRFANGSSLALICTDLASRGLDIPDIDNIIHYHLPETEDAYIHRVGRTARWDKTGRTFFILAPGEKIPSYVEALPQDFQLSLHPPQPARPRMGTVYIGKGKKDKISKGDIVGFLCKNAGLAGTDVGRIDVKDRYSYAAVTRARLKEVVRTANGQKIKGVRTVVELAATDDKTKG